jgi:hypothetical protein
VVSKVDVHRRANVAARGDGVSADQRVMCSGVIENPEDRLDLHGSALGERRRPRRRVDLM